MDTDSLIIPFYQSIPPLEEGLRLPPPVAGTFSVPCLWSTRHGVPIAHPVMPVAFCGVVGSVSSKIARVDGVYHLCWRRYLRPAHGLPQ